MRKILSLFFVLTALSMAAEAGLVSETWVKSMQEVHKNFKGKKGTVVLFGDSITEDENFWTTMREGVKNADFDAAKAIKYIDKECWENKGESYGNKSGWKTKDLLAVYQQVIKNENPEIAIIMIGTNDTADQKCTVTQYTENLTKIITDLKKNGTVPILSTMPNRQISSEGVKKYNIAVKEIAEKEQIPLIDLFGYLKTVNKKIWSLFVDGTHLKWGGENDFALSAMSENGVAARNYVTLKKYSEVMDKVLLK